MRPLTNPVFLPLTMSGLSVSGQVTQNGQPLPGVTIQDAAGNAALTDSGGRYALAGLPEGANSLTATKSGYLFAPSPQEVSVSGSNVVNFSAAACSELVLNGGFEDTTSTAWDLPVTEYPAVYATDRFHSGARSVRTGIVSGSNVYSYSSARQLFSVPSTATSVTLRLWLYPVSGEAATLAVPSGPAQGESADATDAQYILVLNSKNELLETLMWTRRNTATWEAYEFNLTKWAGQSIKIQVGTFNDGIGGLTSMYVDDVSVQACTNGTTPPPAPGGCANYFTNSGFESDLGWSIPITAYSAGYSTFRFHSGARSMRTGIVFPEQDTYSYSDAFQYVTIPSNATEAEVNFWYFPMSGEVSALRAQGEDESLPIPPATTLEELQSTLASDAQYVLVIDNKGVIHYPFWILSNSQTWRYAAIDLMAYRGQTVRIQFGTFNNKDGSQDVTALYIDDMFADICTGTTPGPTPTPTPTPVPGTCTERVSNGGFESDASWVIPLTNYSAGYSTFLKRTGARSMRTGIYYPSQNTYSYSDFRQTVSIPSGTKTAKLSFYIYPRSNVTTLEALPEQPAAEGIFGTEALSGDIQYVLILDRWGNWINTLLWERTNAQTWVYKEFDLAGYAGETINIQWGTYNDGGGGVTAMYVDDARLQACP